MVVVEHADQHPAGLLGEPAHVAVDESLLQLRGGDVAAPVGVHSHEPLPHLLLLAEVVHVDSVTLLTSRVAQGTDKTELLSIDESLCICTVRS